MPFLAGLATPLVGSACSIVFVAPPSVRSSFQVKVSGDDGPAKGLLLKLTSLKRPTQSAITDGFGIAHFDNIPPGTWYFAADPDNGFGGQVDVKRNGPANVTIPMQWPSVKPIHVRSLSGTMRAPLAVPGQLEQPILSLEVLDGISGRVLSSINTSAYGEFDFGKFAPGLYFIHEKPNAAFSRSMEGLISVAVDPAAAAVADKLDLNLNSTSCGLMYTDQSQCPYPELRLKKLQGRVSDSGRPVRGGAEVLLLDATQNQVAQVSTDSSGNFSFPGSLVGAFELRLEGGFTPVHMPIHIEPSADSSSLEIEVNVIGCSTVRAN